MHKQRFKIGSSIISWKQGRLFLMILTEAKDVLEDSTSANLAKIFCEPCLNKFFSTNTGSSSTIFLYDIFELNFVLLQG